MITENEGASPPVLGSPEVGVRKCQGESLDTRGRALGHRVSLASRRQHESREAPGASTEGALQPGSIARREDVQHTRGETECERPNEGAERHTGNAPDGAHDYDRRQTGEARGYCGPAESSALPGDAARHVH